MKLGNNRWETAKFNERAQLTEIGIGVGVTDNSVWKLEYKYGIESGSVNANKNTGNIARSVMTLAGVAIPIVQNYRYDSLYRLTEAEEKNNTTICAGQNWTLPARPAAEQRQSLAVGRKPTESDRIPNPSRRATAHRILDFRFRILDFANPQELRVHA